MLGVVDATFPTHTYPMKPGDKVLLYSDGMDTAVFEGGGLGAESLMVAAERHRKLPVRELTALGYRLVRRRGATRRPDASGLEVVEQE